jgi:FixJ family two-component response regulator
MIFLGIKLWLVRSSSKKSWISEQVSMISIIDDDRSVREAVKSLIRSLGYEAVTFASAEEYLGADGAHDSECVITDVQMPGGMTGMDLQNRLIADGYRRPIIFMSALSAEDAGATAASRFLRKPFSDERLIDCLDQALKDPAPNSRRS